VDMDQVMAALMTARRESRLAINGRGMGERVEAIQLMQAFAILSIAESLAILAAAKRDESD